MSPPSIQLRHEGRLGVAPEHRLFDLTIALSGFGSAGAVGGFLWLWYRDGERIWSLLVVAALLFANACVVRAIVAAIVTLTRTYYAETEVIDLLEAMQDHAAADRARNLLNPRHSADV